MASSVKASFIILFLTIVLKGNDVVLPGIAGVNGDIFRNQDNNAWYKAGVKLVEDNLKLKANTNTAKSAILFLGDGMGITTITATRFLDGQQKGNTGEENVLSWEVFPWSALAKTYSVNEQGTDSASTATAFLTGIKTDSGVIGVSSSVTRFQCSSVTEQSKAASILTLAEKAGMSTGIVTTARITHATPACAYAHSANRNWESDGDISKTVTDDGSKCKDIALQLLEFPYGNGMEVVFGGGRRELMHKNQTDPEYPDKKGDRLDGRDLISEWVNKFQNSKYVWNKNEFEQIDVDKVDHVIGLFEPSHMNYEVERASDKAGEPSIAEMTEKAIKILQKNPKGFFLLVEGGRIDHGHHAGRAVKALNDAIAMNKAVARTLEIVNKDETLITVTADHSHVFTIGGYPKRGNPVFGIIQEVDNTLAVDKGNKTYTTLGYANGPGGLNGSRQDLRNVNTSHKDFLQQATVLTGSETHGSEDVGVFADGPGAYLFHGVVEQQYVFHVMDYALCLSESKQKSCEKHVNRGGTPTSKSGALSLSVHSLYFLLLIAISYVVFVALEA